MTPEVWWIVGGVSVLVLLIMFILWQRMAHFHWYCRGCKKMVSHGRFHPSRCQCGSQVLLAYYCRDCLSWNTSRTSSLQCNACSSKNVVIGVEYHVHKSLWLWRKQRE